MLPQLFQGSLGAVPWPTGHAACKLQSNIKIAPSPPGFSTLAIQIGFSHNIIMLRLTTKQKSMQGSVIRERERISQKACDNCQEDDDDRSREDNFLAQISGPLLESREHGRVQAAFHCRTRRNISIERRSLQELQFYYIPKKEEMFHRGLGLNLNNGQYIAPFSGYYIFTATLHIEVQLKKNQPRTRERLRLLICGRHQFWHRNLSCFAYPPLSSLFQAGQYASVFVDNATGSTLTVRSGSDFGAVLLGI
uniref:Erythroferrone n=1 Tax=Podarcis muralis TaxID=64176 RepID=A0A670IHI7_PODMU